MNNTSICFYDPVQVVQDPEHQKEVVHINHTCRARFDYVQYRLHLLFLGKVAHFVINDRNRANPIVQVMNSERHQHDHEMDPWIGYISAKHDVYIPKVMNHQERLTRNALTFCHSRIDQHLNESQQDQKQFQVHL
jgi:hypothetical protein|uniref:Uncharacterized protein n=1 Tax=viral metagenome TaxID=1070528 RepID=A0A6C0BRA6_9ZZZZ